MIETKIEYDLWANEQVCKQLKMVSSNQVLSEVTRLFNHLLKAQVVWYNRVNGIKEKVEIWDDFTLDECKFLLNDSRAMLEGIASKIGETITYQNSKGITYTDTSAHIFEHVIIHGQHHRAQIYLLLRKAGITPPATDFIFYLHTL